MLQHRFRAKHILILCSLLGPSLWAKNLRIKSSVDSRVSNQGEPIRLGVSVYTESRDTILEPKLPLMTDWQVVKKYSNPSFSTKIVNGQITFSQKNEYVYFLLPMRKGELRIPKLEVRVGQKLYATDPITIAVKQVADDPIARKFNNPGGGNPSANPFGGSQVDTSPNLAPINPQEGVFVRSEPSKTDVFLGELIVVPFYLYFRDTHMRNAEIAKFPTFRGFLKEELFVPKTMTQNPVQVGGHTYYRTELIRYALFPLKVGKLSLDSLVFKADAMVSPSQLMDAMAYGNPFDIIDNIGQSYPVSKSAKTLDILVKPLPTAPAGSIFTGGVGQFEMKVKGPERIVSTGQPFSVTMEFRGRGNVKSIEEPPLSLPEGLESFETKTSMEFSEQATGHKTFEFLLLSRKPGTFDIPPMKWTYFDPDKRQYVTAEGPPLKVQIEGAATETLNIAESPSKEEKSVRFSPIRVETQKFERAEESGILLGTSAWGAMAFAYAALGFAFFSRRRREIIEADLARAPYKITEQKILSKKSRPALRLANLLDQWTREWLVFKLGLPLSMIEESREVLLDELKKGLPPEYYKELSNLKNYWAELDQMRFAGQNKTTEVPCAQEFKRARTLMKQIDTKLLARTTGSQEA
jgi:hypothetical protein